MNDPFWPQRYDDDYIKRLWLEGPAEFKKLFQQEWPLPSQEEIETVANHSPAQARAIIFAGGRRGGKSEKMRAESERSTALESALQALENGMSPLRHPGQIDNS